MTLNKIRLQNETILRADSDTVSFALTVKGHLSISSNGSMGGSYRRITHSRVLNFAWLIKKKLKNNLYLSSAVFIAHMLAGLRK